MDRHRSRDRSWWRHCGRVPALVCLPLLACAAATDSPCRWRVAAVRPATADERPLADRDLLLADPADPNDVPGPDSVRFVVRKSRGHKPAIYREDERTGRVELLLDRASGPRVSPDGGHLACIVWRSIKRPWNLLILDLKTRRQMEPPLDGCATPYEWSPDAKWIAVMVTPCQSPPSRLALVSMPSGRVRWLDSWGVFADYEFGWSSDSQHLAVLRPTAVDPDTEEPIASELWIFSDGGRRRCRLDTPPGYVHPGPRWISDGAILVDRLKQSGRNVVGQDRVVLEVSEDRHP